MSLSGKTVAFLVAPEGIEQVELTEPWKAVERRAARRGWSRSRPARCRPAPSRQGRHVPGRRRVADAGVDDYDALVLPGGVANPDFLRAEPEAVAFAEALLRRGQAGRGHLPRAVDPGRGRGARGAAG